MWRIPKPHKSAADAFDICRGGITNDDLANRLDNIRDDIVEAEGVFDTAASNVNLHQIVATTDVGGTVTAREMCDLYDRHMAREKSRGRRIYDDLMIAAPDDRCPFCGHRNVSTLDHSLTKARHPALAVTPINLIPCCKDCNHKKGNQELVGKADQFLNAYYDNVTEEAWLKAEIIEGSPAGIRFFVEPPAEWDEVTSQRVRNQFEKLELAKLYASQGGRQLQNMRGALKETYDADGAQGVADDLLRSHRSCSAIDANAWLTSLYQAAAQSDWYCDGGFDA